MEDVCREAASVEVDLEALTVVHLALVNAVSFSSHAQLYEPLKAAVEHLINWLQTKVCCGWHGPAGHAPPAGAALWPAA